MASEPGIIAFASREKMAARVADLMEAVLGRAIADRGGAALALSGGSTPTGLYKELSCRKLDWDKVDARLVDERWVAPGTKGSNETFVSQIIEEGETLYCRFVGLWSDAPTPSEGLAVAENRFGELGTPNSPFDVVVLGMGNDGHTASWFPNCNGLQDALAESGPVLAAVTANRSEVTGNHVQRMTMTLGAVKSARTICLLIAGDDKRATFEKTLEPGPVEDMPVRAILRARPDLWVCWAP